MKKLIYLIIAFAMIVSCSKNEQPEINGNVTLNIERESGAFADVNTATKANPTIPDTYSVITENAQGGQESVGTGNYSAIKNGFTLKAGTGYKMSAFNVTQAVAESSIACNA